MCILFEIDINIQVNKISIFAIKKLILKNYCKVIYICIIL
ncbi:hypothetical protein Catovirus_1_943 [Catovirus CTV1]|uniref:Uncharacterized protein n=1 Tax=Catovirus CTV1 TaxID=1977631 RepID=A0A1V0SB11_9VIRU|nr:hypothetical protein Catovirus_1_943 [Catovirus CTV1]